MEGVAYKMNMYLVPVKRASRGAATSPATGEATTDSRVKAARPLDGNILTDCDVETEKRQETSNGCRDRGREAAQAPVQERGRAWRALISAASGDLAMRSSPRCWCIRGGFDIGSHRWVVPGLVGGDGEVAYWRGKWR